MKEPVTVIRENRDSLLESQDYSRLKQMSPSDTHGVWTKTSRFATICCLPRVLYVFGIKKPIEQQAWREKVTLCLIVASVMGFVAYFTIGLRLNICSTDLENPIFTSENTIRSRSEIQIRGTLYDFYDMQKAFGALTPPVLLTSDWFGQDLTRLFDFSRGNCDSFVKNSSNFCSVPNKFPQSPNLTVAACLSPSFLDSWTPTSSVLTVQWKQLPLCNSLVVFDSMAMNLSNFFATDFNTYTNLTSLEYLTPGLDCTRGMSLNYETAQLANCLSARYSVARLGTASVGCAIYSVLMITALTAVMGVILIRVLMALVFHWIIAPRISSSPSLSFRNNGVGFLSIPNQQSYFTPKDQPGDEGPLYQQGFTRAFGLSTDLHTICLVTCYSEDEASIRGTLDSLAGTDYPDDRKLLFVICDGLIHGAGNDSTTPDIVISMIEQEGGSMSPTPMSYLAIADGSKQTNMAQVYAVVKCGTPKEREATSSNELAKKKPGNRGKRDSQLILMHFLSRVTFNDRMTALDYDLFCKIQLITGGITADKYELLMMVDADTVVNSDSLRYMVQTMVNDPLVMGLCGETRIANKMQSWVTMIQVYEYFTNHNLGKSFESVFGGFKGSKF